MRPSQSHLSKELPTTPPRRPDTRKRRTIRETSSTQPNIKPLHIKRLRPLRRPTLPRQQLKRLLRHPHTHPRQHTTRMTHPLNRPQLTTHLPPRTRMNRKPTPARLLSLPNQQLQLKHPRTLQHKRRLQRQLLNHPTTNLNTSRKSHLHKRSTRHNHRLQKHMIRYPWLASDRYAPSEQPLLVLTRELYRSTKQRMPRAAQPNSLQLTPTNRSLQPITLALKSIRRKIDRPRTTTTQQHPPIHRGAPHPGVRQRMHKPLHPTLTTTQRAQHPDPLPHTKILKRFPDRTHQHRVRTHLDKRTRITSKRTNSLLEPHPLPQTPIPILPTQPSRIHKPTHTRREKRHPTRHRRNPPKLPNQLLPQLLNHHRMRRIINRHPPRPHTITLTHPQKLIQRPHLTRHHHRRRTIHRRHTQPPTPPRQTLPHPLHIKRDTHHPTTTSQHPTQQPTPQHHHPRPIPKRQTTRHTRRRDLPLRMPNHHPRLHTKRTPQPRQRHHHRPRHRLHHIHPLQPRRTPHTPQHILNPPTHQPLKHIPTRPQQTPKHHRRTQQPNRHTLPLRTLPRKHKHRPTTPRHTPHHTHTGHTTRTRTQTLQQPLTLTT